MTNFTDLQTKRRSIYALGKDVELSNQELIDTMNENMTVERTKDDGTKHIVSSEQYLDESIAHIQSLGYFAK